MKYFWIKNKIYFNIWNLKRSEAVYISCLMNSSCFRVKNLSLSCSIVLRFTKSFTDFFTLELPGKYVIT